MRANRCGMSLRQAFIILYYRGSSVHSTWTAFAGHEPKQPGHSKYGAERHLQAHWTGDLAKSTKSGQQRS